MLKWLNQDFKTEIKTLYEPLYKRALSEKEVEEIAENLTNLVETIIKFNIKKDGKQKQLNQNI